MDWYVCYLIPPWLLSERRHQNRAGCFACPVLSLVKLPTREGSYPGCMGSEGRMGTDTQGDRFERSIPAQAVPVPWQDNHMGEMPLA